MVGGREDANRRTRQQPGRLRAPYSPTLTPEQAEAHTWRPDEKIWETIKNHSIRQPATVSISGYSSQNAGERVSIGQAEIQTSTDPVGAPILYRDVPLLPATKEQIERGVSKPSPDSVLRNIKWELRYVSATKSKVVMHSLPTCANCHSVSRDGKTLGIDVDGPQNDKGLYALVPIHKQTTISTRLRDSLEHVFCPGQDCARAVWIHVADFS
jgi:hypothetical protein